MLLKFLISNDFMIKLRRFLSIPTLYINEVWSAGRVENSLSNKVSISFLISDNESNSRILFKTIDKNDYSSMIFKFNAFKRFK